MNRDLAPIHYIAPEDQLQIPGMTVTVLHGDAAANRWNEAVRQYGLLMAYCETMPGELR